MLQTIFEMIIDPDNSSQYYMYVGESIWKKGLSLWNKRKKIFKNNLNMTIIIHESRTLFGYYWRNSKMRIQCMSS